MNPTIADLIDRLPTGSVSEASLSRVLAHTQGTFAILSAYRGERSARDNKSAQTRLLGDLKSLQRGAIKISGLFRETRPDGSTELVSEPSLVVPNIDAETASRLGKKYGQEAVLWGGDEAGGVFLLWQDGRREWIGKRLTLKIASDIFSRLKGRDFAFEGLRYVPTGFIDALAWRSTLLGAAERCSI